MRIGFERLQAVIRTRQLVTSYKEMRRRVIVFQACCRGSIARRELRMKMGAIITIQAGFKMVYAKKELEKRRKEVFAVLWRFFVFIFSKAIRSSVLIIYPIIIIIINYFYLLGVFCLFFSQIKPFFVSTLSYGSFFFKVLVQFFAEFSSIFWEICKFLVFSFSSFLENSLILENFKAGSWKNTQGGGSQTRQSNVSW